MLRTNSNSPVINKFFMTLFFVLIGNTTFIDDCGLIDCITIKKQYCCKRPDLIHSQVICYQAKKMAASLTYSHFHLVYNL
jgi:hypothetical protein